MSLAVCLVALSALPLAPSATAMAGARASASDRCPAHVLAIHGLDSATTAIRAIAALSATDVWAAGSINIDRPLATYGLIEHYDGKVWCAVDTHDWTADGYPGTGFPGLYALAAISPRDVWAVGTRVEHWDGQAWRVVPSLPNGWPTLVSASSADNVWATNGTLVQRWDGHRWQEVPPPSTLASLTSIPEALATSAATDTWLVGATRPGGIRGPWVAHWDGRQWQETQLPRAPSPAGYGSALQAACDNPGPDVLHLNSAAALRSDDIWAVGWQMTSTLSRPICSLAFHWDGTSWQQVWQPVSPDYLSLLVATPGRDIWDVDNPAFQGQRYDGHTWQPVRSFGSTGNGLNPTSMSAVSDDDIWAVGSGAAAQWDGRQWKMVSITPVG